MEEEIVYTHLGKLYGFKCYVNIETFDIMGTNWFNDFMIELCAYIAVDFLDHQGFNIQIICELEK